MKESEGFNLQNRLELDPQKLYYSIGEVANLLALEPSTIRYWESCFPQLNPKKTALRRRQYTADDIRLLEEIYYLLRIKGVSIAQAKYQLGNMDKREINRVQAISKLMRIERVLEELKQKI